MASSAEESSPVEYFESCCICDEEFSSDSVLADHLWEHANDEQFKISLKKFEQKNSIPEQHISRPLSFAGQPVRRSFNQQTGSPEVVELLSDESDDESVKTKRQAAPPIASNQVKTASTIIKPTQNSRNPVQTNPTPTATQSSTYNCTQCLMVFKDLKLYKEHLSTHDKSRPYVCQICNTKFAYKSTLRQHLYLHIGKKTHKCKVCHKIFSFKRMLRRHEETHEQEQH